MPIIFEPPAALLAAQSAGAFGSPGDGSGVAPNGGSQVWIAASPTNASVTWGGCQVWLSFDDVTYGQIGTIASRANQAVLTAALASPLGGNPDTTDTLAVDLSMSGGSLPTGSDADAQAARTVCYVDGELIAYGLATPTTGDAYNLTDLYRGLYGTAGALHASGAPFVLLDDNVFKYNLPSSYAGQTLYFKFASFNAFGGGTQDLSALTAVSYTPSAGVVPAGLITGGDASVSSSGVFTLASTGVAAGSYTYGSFTVDPKGRLTAAVSGTAPVTTVGAAAPLSSSGGANPTISLVAGALPNGMTAATQSSGDNSTKVATDAFVQAALPIGANPSATAGPTAVNGSASAFMRSDAAPAIQKASAAQFGIVEVDGTTITASGGVITAALRTSANPTGQVGLAASNGSAATFMRSDGAPALSQSISPTWTGNHTFHSEIIGATGSVSAPTYGFGAALPGFFLGTGAIGTNNALLWSWDGVSHQWQVSYSSSAIVQAMTGYGQQAEFSGQRADGTSSAPTAVVSGDIICSYVGQGYNGSSFVAAGRLYLEASNPSGSVVPGEWVIQTVNAAGTLTTGLTIDSSQNVFSGGGTKIADSSGALYTATSTVSGLPAAGVAGRRRFVTDATATTFATIVAGGGSNGVPVYDDGTNWRVG